MSTTRLPPALERRALALVEALVDADEPADIDALLAAEDAQVAARVRRLLDAAGHADASLPTELGESIGAPLTIPPRVGPFALVERIGQGGMGEVWRAERADGLYEQSVAIKFLRYHGLALGARFAEERRILARLEHPNIARLIDGGVTDAGVPYLVMEHVPGRHIDEAAAGRPLADRIALFEAAVAAVQFAHGRLVVHADLKPSNIIVGDGGQVKLLDFGVARLIGEGGDAEARAHPMTPEFASPARRDGGAPVIADDVFALGRILGGLIGAAADADLSAIVAKAGVADEARRYPTTGALLADLARWRERLPVTARAATVRYRAGRFVARHRLGVAATTVAMLVLAGLAIAASLAARAATIERHNAERRFDEVRALSRFMLFELYDELGNAPGTVIARARIATTAGRYLDRLSRSPGATPALRLEVAQGYERLARVQGVSGVASLGRPSEAKRSLDRAGAIAGALLAAAPRDPAVLELLGRVTLDRWTLAAENAASAPLNARAQRFFDRALAIEPGRPGALIGTLTAEKNRAFDLIWTEDRPQDALPVLRAALARLHAARFAGSDAEDARKLEVALLTRLGDATYYAGDVPGSLVAFRRAEAIIDAQLARRETLAWLERRGEILWEISGSLEEARAGEALAAARAGVATMRRVLSYGPDANAEKWLAILYNQEAGLLMDAKDFAGGLAAVRQSVAIRERRAAAEPDDPRRARDLAVGLGTAAHYFANAGRASDACGFARRSLGAWAEIRRRGRLGKLDAAKALPAAWKLVPTLCG